jgi:hypothetical protein
MISLGPPGAFQSQGPKAQDAARRKPLGPQWPWRSQTPWHWSPAASRPTERQNHGTWHFTMVGDGIRMMKICEYT